ncbi:hypothetical protein FB451DRAFT_1399755 [Mycena latifolia]|nr:hypothetical protein FB451DRAFT_1399755 [Mycena latifolia]
MAPRFCIDLEVISNIADVLSGAIDVAHRVFLVAPAVVKDNGGRRFVREDFFAEFLTPAVAAKTFELALSRAFDVSPCGESPAGSSIAKNALRGHTSLVPL